MRRRAMLGGVVLLAVVIVGWVWAGSALMSATARDGSGEPLAAVSALPTAPTVPASSAPGGPDASAGVRPVPVYAYLYQWFTSTSWGRAKIDYPLAGRYSSDDPQVLLDQARQARAAGIDGFFTSWKSTDPLNRRLDMLTHVARSEGLDLGVVYQGLDFARDPLPVATIASDMVYLLDRWGPALTSSYYGKPVIIWTGTDQFSLADVRTVRDALGGRAYLLASSHSITGYERVAGLVDGEAYYWSSANPTSANTLIKLSALGEAVHSHGGLWIAPAAPGYDGRPLGGTRVIDRHGGDTLVRSLDNAFASSPDGVGVISWNEWSENTYIEPGETYGSQDLDALTAYLRGQGRHIPVAYTQADSSEGSTSSGWTGAKAAATLAALTALAIPGASVLGRRRRRGYEAWHRQGSPPV